MRALAAALVGAVMACGCGGSKQASDRLVLHAGPRAGLVDAPLRVTVTGAKPGALVTVRLSTKDARGTKWSSSATFRADSRGTVDPARSAPVRGSYRGRDGEGLVWSMQPGSQSSAAFIPRYGRTAWDVAATAPGVQEATTGFTRQTGGDNVRVRALHDGLVGDYFASTTKAPRPPVMLIGGSEGGVSTGFMASLLASHGHPSLALGYFGAPGLPANLREIPLEYFARAARWLERQRGVDRRRLVVLGGSRGSEAALLLASDFPQLVHSVVALSPSSKVNSSLDGRASGWTLHGRPLPYAYSFDADPAFEPKSVIPVQRIGGPLLLVAGGEDKTWPSAAYAKAIARRASRARVLIYPQAGHGVAFAIPDLPDSAGEDSVAAAATAHARADLWPKLLRFLDE